MSEPIKIAIVFESTTCWKCGVPIIMPDYLLKSRREDGRTFWCPNGHGAHYPDGRRRQEEKENGIDHERQEEQIRAAHLQDQLEAKVAELEEQVAAAETRAKAAESAAKASGAQPAPAEPDEPAKRRGVLAKKGGRR